MRFVALESFVDPSDGVPVVAGQTLVDGSADVYRMFPQRFKEIARDEAHGGAITRIQSGATAQLTGGRPRRPRAKAASPDALPFGYDYHHVELLERGYVDFSVNLGSGARKTILDAIGRAGADRELAGWLFAQSRPRDLSRSASIAYATVTAQGTGTSVSIGDPIDGIVAAREAGIGEAWNLVGDWHSHPSRGSELPSLQDCRAWSGTMDELGRTAYVSLIVSPSESMGWTCPKFSAWVAGRHGYPSRPMVGRARMAWE